MAKLSLKPDATFKAKVAVPIPGGNADIECEFKYRSREAAQKWIEAKRDDESDAEVLLDCMAGWDLDDEFNPENIKRLCSTYPGAGHAIVTRYLSELAGIRRGN